METHEQWLPMETAPKDGTLIRLLVEFEHHATEDCEGPQPTIGSNTWDNHHNFDEWQFAGWNWEQDCYTQGVGKPVGWMPMLTTPALQGDALSQSARDVLAERMRQLKKEGWTRAHDDKHSDGSLAAVAACYAVASVPYMRGEVPVSIWPKSWTPSWWKPSDPRRNLIKAGALILAELERIDRAARKQGGA